MAIPLCFRHVSSLQIVIKLWTRRLFLLILTVLLGSFSLLYLSFSIAAAPGDPADDPDADQTGTVEIRLEPGKSGRSWNGVEFEAYYCAGIDLESGQLDWLEPYKGCTLDTESFSSTQAVQEAITYLAGRKTEPAATAAVNEAGVAVFENLAYGLWLFSVSKPAEYDLVGSFLAILPCWNEEEERFETHLSVRAKANELCDIAIRKTDPEGQPIVGKEFVFASYLDRELTRMAASVSGDPATGLARFRPCLGQTFYLKEISAPQGYVLSDRIVKVTMDKDGSLYVDNVKKKPDSSMLVAIDYENKPVPDTPQTSKTPGDSPASEKEILTSHLTEKETLVPGPTGKAPAGPQTKPATSLFTGRGKWLVLAVGALAASGLLLGMSIMLKKRRLR